MLTLIKKVGGEEYVLEQVAAGKSLTRVAEMIGCSISTLSQHMNATEERKGALRKAREVAATSLVDQGLEIVDRATDAAEVPSAKLRSEYRRWMAGRMARDTWGEPKQGPQVAIQINGLHLDALRAVGKVRESD